MKILLFGGTTEGRELAPALAEAGHKVSVSVATPLGAEMLPERPGLSVLTGTLGEDEIRDLVKGYDLCVDASLLGLEETEKLIADFIRKRFGL